MDDPAFEMRLTRLFAEAPAYHDAPLFVAEIESRLGRGWALRRVLIAGGGAVGALIAIGQVIGSGLAGRLDMASHMLDTARQGISHLPVGPQVSFFSDMPFGGEVLWLVGGLAVLAAALLAGRSLEEI